MFAYQSSSRYFSSVFLGHATVENLKISFKKTVGTHLLPKPLQILMDGACDNYTFYDQFSEHCNDKYKTAY